MIKECKMTDEKLELAELIESKLLNIIAEIAPQKEDNNG